MRFAFSTNAYTRFPLPKALKQIKSHGYEGVEILADIPHAFPLDFSAREIAKVGRTLEQNALVLSNINANTAVGFLPAIWDAGEIVFEPSLCSHNEESRLLRIGYTKKCIDLAVEWGSPCISITSGRCLPGNPPKDAYQNFIQSLQQILEYAVKKNVYVGIEYEPGLLIENADEAEKLLQDMSCRYLGVNLDIGHAEVIGEDLPATIRRFANKIWNVHLEDIKKRKHYHLIPGEGDIDFSIIFETLNQISYRKFLTLELYTYLDSPDAAAKDSMNYLRDYFRKDDGSWVRRARSVKGIVG